MNSQHQSAQLPTGNGWNTVLAATVGMAFGGSSLASMYFLSPSIIAFYFSLVLVSVCALGVWPITYLRATAGWFDTKLGIAMGIVNAGIGLGAALTPIVVESVAL